MGAGALRPVAAAAACVLLGLGACGSDTGERRVRSQSAAPLSADPTARSAAQPRPSAVGSRTDRWTPLSHGLIARTEVGAARIGRYVYVVGGFEQRTGTSTRSVERYDIAHDHWSRAAAMPVGLNHAGAAAYHGRLYVFGGYARAQDDQVGASGALYRFDPSTKAWSKLRSAPTPRAAMALGVIADHLYVAGGANARDGALKSLEIYDFKTRRWSSGPPMRVAREHLAGAVQGGRFYVLAGRAAGRGNFTVVERYDPVRRRWDRLADMRKARGGIAAATVGKRIVVFGGEEAAGTIREVEALDTTSGKWSSLPAMRTPRHGLGGVSMGHRVYAIEGGPMPGLHYSKAIELLRVP
jgi:N-acetylneuraminic acid mutarotase